eukprot:5427564-Amphidinium_carterae.1
MWIFIDVFAANFKDHASGSNSIPGQHESLPKLKKRSTYRGVINSIQSNNTDDGEVTLTLL